MQQGSNEALQELIKQDPLVGKFHSLVLFDTQSSVESTAVPSTRGQLEIASYVQGKAAEQVGLDKVTLKDTGVLQVRLGSTEGCEHAPHLCLLAHVDTAPDCSGKNVKPALVTGFDGDVIKLKNGLTIDSKICPQLPYLKGHDIIVTDGTTLLGGDDKAGCAVMWQLMEDCVLRKLPHGPLTLVFSVDEEIGKSTSYIDVKELGADVALTIDGAGLGELDVATFNASLATLTFKGTSVHTAVAYGRLKNALKMACQFVDELPCSEAPETTRGDEGFYHPMSISGGVEQAVVRILLRDFEEQGLKARENFILDQCAKFKERFGPESLECMIEFQYQNMQGPLMEAANSEGGRLDIVGMCKEACLKAGVQPVLSKVRGGTDGSNLSNRGLPCPNLFTGAFNCHGPYECVSVQVFHQSYECVKNLVEIVAAR